MNYTIVFKLLSFILVVTISIFSGYRLCENQIDKKNLLIEELLLAQTINKDTITNFKLDLKSYYRILNDGDFVRYIALKHSDIKIPKNIDISDLKLIYRSSERFNIPHKYIYRLINKESNYNPTAKSHVGASGYMQLMPATYNSLLKKYEKQYTSINKLERKKQNIILGTFFLKELYDQFNDWELVFAAYNAGPTRVQKTNKVPNITETKNYVKYIIKK